jgi:hypothetical protein
MRKFASVKVFRLEASIRQKAFGETLARSMLYAPRSTHYSSSSLSSTSVAVASVINC